MLQRIEGLLSRTPGDSISSPGKGNPVNMCYWLLAPFHLFERSNSSQRCRHTLPRLYCTMVCPVTSSLCGRAVHSVWMQSRTFFYHLSCFSGRQVWKYGISANQQKPGVGYTDLCSTAWCSMSWEKSMTKVYFKRSCTKAYQRAFFFPNL